MCINGTMLLRCLQDTFGVHDEIFHNWLMLSLVVCYGLVAFFWTIGLIGSSSKTTSSLYTTLGLLTLFSAFAAITNIQGTAFENQITFFFQSVSRCLLLLSLLMASSGHEITRSSRDVSINQFAAVGACILYASFDIFAISGQIGYPVQQIVYPVAFVVFTAWILINVLVTKQKATSNKPRQLFFQHFTEAFLIYIFCIVGLSVANYVGCYYNWSPENYAIIHAIKAGVTVILVGMMMIMLRPSRMALIGFRATEPCDEKKILVDAMYGDVAVETA